MPMKTSTRFVKAAVLNLFTALVLCVLCEWLALYVFHTATLPAGQSWIWPMFFINFVFAWCIATVIGMIPSLPEKSVKWAMKHAKPSDGLKFGLLVNLPINTVYAIILCYLVGTLDAGALGGAPLIASVFGFLQNIIPVWVVCYIVTFFLQGPIENLARKATNDPAPQMA